MSSAYCRLAPGHPVHGIYHDSEYGFPASNEQVLFERLILEINQAGLSWATILRKRAAFRAAFADFDVDRVAVFGLADTERLMTDSGIIRNRLKIEAAIENAPARASAAPIAPILRRLARCAPSALRGRLDAALSADVSFHWRADRQ